MPVGAAGSSMDARAYISCKLAHCFPAGCRVGVAQGRPGGIQPRRPSAPEDARPALVCRTAECCGEGDSGTAGAALVHYEALVRGFADFSYLKVRAKGEAWVAGRFGQLSAAQATRNRIPPGSLPATGHWDNRGVGTWHCCLHRTRDCVQRLVRGTC